MFRFFIASLVFVAISSGSFAGEHRVPGMRTNDRYYTPFGLKQKIMGRVVTYENGQRFHYYKDGSFDYEPHEGADTQSGRYKIRDNGMVCAHFDRGRVRCDTYVRSTKFSYFLTGNGQRWKIKSFVRE